jgi:putative two-component system response regulator
MYGAGGMHGSAAFGEAQVLLVDDHQMNLKLLRMILEEAGYSNVTSTNDPREVVDLFHAVHPDIILLDLHMPHMTGIDVLNDLHPWLDRGKGHYLPVLMLTADGSREAMQQALSAGARDFVTKPFDAAEVLLRIHNLLETRFLHLELLENNRTLEAKVVARTGDLQQAICDLETARHDLRESQEETVHRLALAAEYRDDETARHILRMSQYCEILAKAAGMADEDAELMRVASQMHDVGKLGTPDSILLKPAALTPEERVMMERHAEMGHSILANSNSDLLQLAAKIAYTHHERVDGTGYPRRLRGDEIPLEGRIAAVADIFDALTSDRVYRPAFPLTKALNIMQEGRAKHLDPDMLDLFLAELPQVLEAQTAFADEATPILQDVG